jgi:cytochrome c oxidase subunit 2
MFVGLILTTVSLIGFVGWTVSVMAAIQNPARKPQLSVAITAHQWWWEAQYLAATPSESFVTANEIHIPVGIPVEFEIKSADVIHSFWVPALGGKTDAIPGRTNVTWLEADKPGVYRGQCSEYCGTQHSHMAFLVIAQTPGDYQKWRQGQLAPAAAPASAQIEEGERDFVLRCGACHTVRGTSAGGQVGPDLTHLMSRQTIAAGELKNNIANLSGWIADPQGVKPGTLMPAVELSGPELEALRTYLLTLH